MIGDIVKIRTPYYDNTSRIIKFKSRPGLVIGTYGLIDNDLIVLPLSKITYSKNINYEYDIPIDPKMYPKLNLRAYSYIRSHKQTVINRKDIADTISSLKENYPEKYIEIIAKVEKFDSEKNANAYAGTI